MVSSGVAIIRTLAGVGLAHEKAYCFPSQETILGLLGQYHEVDMSRRTLNRHLAVLEDQGYFERVRRHGKGKDGQIRFASTLYKFKGKLFKFMYSIGKQADSFFRVFRVPWMAQHQAKQYQGFTSFGTAKSSAPGPGDEKGGPSGISSGDPPPSPDENLSLVRKLLQKIGG